MVSSAGASRPASYQRKYQEIPINHKQHNTTQTTMRKVVHDLADKITEAILPITLNHKNYADILDAMCVVMAKTITSSPGAGSEEKLVELVYVITKKAVEDMKAIDKEGDVPLEDSIADFSKFAKPDEPKP